MLAKLSAHDQHEQLFEQAARIELLGGHRPRLFRPPYGSFNATTFRELHQMNMLMVLWSADTDDYEQPGVETIVKRALEGAKPGAILLMHDAGGNREQTVAALPQVIHELRARGLSPGHGPAAARRRPAARAASRCRRTSPATDARQGRRSRSVRPGSVAQPDAQVSQAPWITISCSETRSGRRSLSRRMARSSPSSVNGSSRPQWSQTR